MIQDWLRIILIAVLTVVGLWGLVTGVKSRKSPPGGMRFYGIYLRIGLLIGAIACLIAAVVLTENFLAG
ncbi:MAG: hypothetical protein JSV52_00815 [Candidatus Zixiibacteriota bacterium]|nr:MAG: hypothetical protein JSV52_00815 [candidate division Zixibacteria bacterium]